MDDTPMPDTVLSARLAYLCQIHPDLTPNKISAVVRAVFGETGAIGAADVLLAEVAELGRTIANAKAEISAMRVDDITGQHIPTATDELDAIVAHTATATDQILETCETLDTVAMKLDGATQATLQDATTRIYEACSFQDITGQRISKVVAALKAIESKVANIVVAFGHPSEPASPPPPDSSGPILNGPQLPAKAMGQSDIDRLMADFD